MKPDITIELAVSGLHNPTRYLERALVHMRSCALAHGNSFIRLGASPHGTGQYPSYRIVYHKDGAERVFGSFVDSGKTFPEPYDKVQPGDWSTSASDITAVVALAASIVEK